LAVLLLAACAHSTGDVILRSKNLIEVQGQYDQAIQLLEAEAARSPSSAAVWYWLGIGRYKKGDYDNASKSLERAFDLKLYKTYHLSACEYLGWSYINTGQYAKAVETFNRALAINPTYVSALLGRGRAAMYMTGEDIDRGINDFSLVLKLQPGNDQALRYRGWSRNFRARYREAVEDFDEALRIIEPGNRTAREDAYRGRGWARYYQGDFSMALPDFEGALQNLERLKTFDNEESRKFFEKFFGRNQDYFNVQDACRGKAYVLAGLGRYDEAAAFIDANREYMTDRDLPLLYYAMGDSRKAWEHRGGEGFIGISMQDYANGSVKGVKIVDVFPGGPAGKAGLQPGDVVTAVDRRQISNAIEMSREVVKLAPGRSLTATVLRGGRPIDFPLVVASAGPSLAGDPLVAPVLKFGKGNVVKADRPPAAVKPAPAPQAAAPVPRVSPGGISQAWAVVVGISRYLNADGEGLTNLAFADDDAKAFVRTLATIGWSESHVRLLINEEATMRNVMIALESWLTKTGPDDLIVLFWSGHGFPDPEDPEKVYLACYDTDIRIPATGYRMDKVRQALEERRSRNVIVLADTCHAGKLITRGGRGISIVPQIDRMKREQAVPKGWIFMVGADSDRQAIEHSSWTNGAFTHTLLKGLSGEADGYESIGPKDGVVTMGELRGFLNSVMPDETQRVLGAAKRPVITTSTGDPDIWNLSLQAR
jgi:tetratricopeptide (TPR) repeat protein